MVSKFIFGGSFNPPTKAHFEIIKAFFDQKNDHLGKRELIIVPNADGYTYANKQLIKFGHRQAMLIKGILEYSLPMSNILIKDFNVDCKTKFLSDLAQELTDNVSPYIIIGDDCVEDLPNWNDYKLLADNYKFLVVKRKYTELEIANICSNLLQEYDINLSYTILNMNSNDDLKNISSSYFRQSKDYNILPNSIVKYIKSHNLYNI